MFSWYKYLIVNLVFSDLGFWSGNLFLIVPFPDLCLLVPFDRRLILVTNFLESVDFQKIPLNPYLCKIQTCCIACIKICIGNNNQTKQIF